MAGLCAPTDLNRCPAVSRVPEIEMNLLRQSAFGAAAEGVGQPNCHPGQCAATAAERRRPRMARYRKTLRSLGRCQSEGFMVLESHEYAGDGGLDTSTGIASSSLSE